MWKFRNVHKSGIYKITINGKLYIGSAKSFRTRWGIHLNDLRKGKHSNPILQRSYLKHGEDAFNFEIIEECSIDKLIEREQYWIDKLNPDYNIRRVAKFNLGIKYSEESRRKISISQIGRKMKENVRIARSRPVLRESPDGEITEYESLAEAFRSTGVPQGNICRAIRKNQKAGECKWRYKYEDR